MYETIAPVKTHVKYTTDGSTTDGTEWISPHLKDYTRVS